MTDKELQQLTDAHQKAQTARREIEKELREIDGKIEIAIVRDGPVEIKALNKRRKERVVSGVRCEKK
jgi:hypothetical protein